MANLKCDCGAIHVGSSGHSAWCSVNSQPSPTEGNAEQPNHVLEDLHQLWIDDLGNLYPLVIDEEDN